MKWPASLTLIRHDTSEYNALKDRRKNDPLYLEFLEARRKDPSNDKTKLLAIMVQEKFALKKGDYKTPLADKTGRQAYETGVALSTGTLPDVIFVSPYQRTRDTLKHLTRGWPALKGVKIYEEERIREQEHGLALLYSDWKVFEAIYPDQKRLRKMEGSYWYRYPQGENVPDVRERNRSWLTTLTRDFAGKHILVINHHLSILATIANLGRFGANDFISLDEKEKPINCGVTVYRGMPDQGKDGRLVLESYNTKHYR